MEQQWLNRAVEVAIAAGRLQRSRLGGEVSIQHKGLKDLVTEVDLASEKIIVDGLMQSFPTHSVLAEEGGLQDLSSSFCWVVDPLDGTTNFAHGFPWFAVSIALLHRETPCIGVIYNPMTDELFTAVAGQGAWCNGRRLQVSTANTIAGSLLATGFPYDCATSPVNNFKEFMLFQRQARGVRRAGAAALDLAYVAKGVFDGFWEFKLNPWDVAAGVLLVQEAGGMVTDHAGGEYRVSENRILASNGRIHQEMVSTLCKENQLNE